MTILTQMFWNPLPSGSLSSDKFVTSVLYLFLHLALGKSASAERLVSAVTAERLPAL